ncbi:MAG: DUF3631 domain-containing protein [Natronohydrobacter sp.]|nr:DUF3631 domain-containing protein [Natronohydrobacter sp.]
MDDLNDWVGVDSVEDVTAPDAQAEVKRLAGLDAAAYETERKGVAARLGWRASILDAEVQKARPRNQDAPDDDDAPEAIETIEAWPDPVEGDSLAEEIRDRLRAHVVFASASDADCAALWLLGSYLMDTWRLWPRLLITSPTKACGKSTLLEVLDAMAHRGFIASNASPAAIFRAIEAWKPTLLLDEADTWMKANEELAGILNSGHTRRTARIIRVVEVKGELTPVAFSTWCPIAIAGIGGQRDTLMSRSIIIGLRRKLNDETVERLPFDLHRQLERIRRQAARWAADNALRIGAMEVEPPACGNDRMQDNFTPLTRIAAALGGPWPDRMVTAYAAKAQVRDDDSEATNIMLLRDVWSLFERNTHQRTRSSSELVEHLLGMDDRPWPEYRHGRPLTASTIARLLRPFDIKSSNIRTGMSVVKGYHRDDVKAAFDRYAAPPAFQPLRRYTTENTQENGNSSRYTGPGCSGFEAEITEQKQSCSGVAAENADAGEYWKRDDTSNPDAW